MIESELIDCRKGEPHVTPEQVADVNIGTYSSDDCVLTTGNRLRAELITNNSVRLFDGVMVYGGLRDVIPVNKYYDVTIDNGAQGKKRNDIIVRRYTKDEGAMGKASSEFAVVKGTSTTGTAADPDIQNTDIRAGALTHDMLLYRVKLEGLNVVAVEQLFEVIPTNKDLSNSFTELKGNLAIKEYQISDFAFQTFYQILDFQCWKIGRMVFMNLGWYANQGTIISANTIYGITYDSVPDEILPNKSVCFQGFACNDDWGEATQISVLLNSENGRIEYSTPVPKSYYKASGFWLV